MSSSHVVLITGVSGYIASVLAIQCLEKGWTVRGTVRSSSPEKTVHLSTHPLLKQVQLFEADLMVDGSFDAAVAGCDIVFHTASPFTWSVSDPQRDLVDPAVNGTRSLLAAVDRAGTVQAVVVTSSVAAVAGTDYAADHVFTPQDWNNTASLATDPYRLSKTLAEKAAWAAAEGKPWKLSTICPSIVLGARVSERADSQSLAWFAAMFASDPTTTGMPPFMKTAFVLIDVVDVAAAHIAVAESLLTSSAAPTAETGRYLCTSEIRYTAAQAVNHVKAVLGSKYPWLSDIAVSEASHGRSEGPVEVVAGGRKFDASRTTAILGRPFRDPFDVFVSTFDEVVRLGLVKHA